VIVLELKLPASEKFQFIAGQYIDILLADGKRRSFSIANAPTSADHLELHIRRVPGGQFTTHVFEKLKEKDILRFEGPWAASGCTTPPSRRSCWRAAPALRRSRASSRTPSPPGRPAR
jgi:ferredoxin-NADP reductase